MTGPRRLIRLGAATLVCLGAALPAQLASPASARASSSQVGLERIWRAFPAQTQLLSSRLALDPRNRISYALWQSANGQGGLRVRAFDLDTYVPRGPALSLVTPSAITSATPIAVDASRSSLILAVAPAASAAPSLTVVGRVASGLRRVADLATRFPPGYVVTGVQVDAPRGRLLLLAQPTAGGTVGTVGAGTGGVLVDVWGLAALSRGTVAAEGAQPIRVGPGCGQVIAASFAAGMVLSADGAHLFFGCASNRGALTLVGPNAGDVSGVMELDLAAALGGATDVAHLRPVAGDFSQGETFAAQGVGRVLLSANSTTVTTFKVFDIRHRRYVGNVGLDDIAIDAFGVDNRTGRGYYLIQSGLGVFDPAATPVTQGVVHENLSPLLGKLTRPFEVDERTGRVFAITAENANAGIDPFVAVLHGAPASGAAAEESTASGGLDAAEVPGHTVSSRTADASALGAEFRLVGGPSNLLLNATHFDSRGVVVKPGTRVEQLSVVKGARLTNDEAAVEAITTRQDDATAADAQNTELAVPLTCVDFGAKPVHLTADSADVSCDLAGSRVAAHASSSAPRMVVSGPTVGQSGLPAAVQLRSASASVTQLRAAGRGAGQVRIDTAADGIDILGLVQIGHVSAHAQVTAHGRHGTASTTYSRTVSGVVVNGTNLCSAECPLSTVAAVINQALGARGHVDFPSPAVTRAASGQEADLVDDAYRHVERVLFEDVPDDSVVTAAMVVTIYADETTPSRLVVSLAELSGRQIYQVFKTDDDVVIPDVTKPGVITPPTGTDQGDLGPAVGVVGPGTVTAIGGTQGGGGGLLSQLTSGLRFALRSWHEVLPVAAVWLLLAVPVYLSARRRLLLALPYLQSEEST